MTKIVANTVIASVAKTGSPKSRMTFWGEGQSLSEWDCFVAPLLAMTFN